MHPNDLNQAAITFAVYILSLHLTISSSSAKQENNNKFILKRLYSMQPSYFSLRNKTSGEKYQTTKKEFGIKIFDHSKIIKIVLKKFDNISM